MEHKEHSIPAPGPLIAWRPNYAANHTI